MVKAAGSEAFSDHQMGEKLAKGLSFASGMPQGTPENS